MNILSSFVHTYVISNLYDFQRMGKKKKKKKQNFLQNILFFLFNTTMKVIMLVYFRLQWLSLLKTAKPVLRK